jgi:hypothetical protein
VTRLPSCRAAPPSLQIGYESFETRPRSVPKPADHRTGVEAWFVHSDVFASERMPGAFEPPREG